MNLDRADESSQSATSFPENATSLKEHVRQLSDNSNQSYVRLMWFVSSRIAAKYPGAPWRQQLNQTLGRVGCLS